jgi:hypothetical protein
MEYFNWNQLNEIVCKALNKFGVYLDYGLDNTQEDDKIAKFVQEEIRKIYPLDKDFYDFLHATIAGGLLTFDTEVEARNFYEIFEQKLTDSSGIYACIYSPIEGCLTENT